MAPVGLSTTRMRKASGTLAMAGFCRTPSQLLAVTVVVEE
jgi:hypothetical protein